MGNTTRKLLLFGVLIYGIAMAQPTYGQYRLTASVELPVKNLGDNYRILPLENDQVLCVYVEDANKTSMLHATLFDSELHTIWSYQSAPQMPGKLIDVGLGEQMIFILRQYDGGELEMLHVDASTGKGRIQKFEPYRGFVASNMVTAGTTCFITGTIDGNTSAFRLSQGDKELHTLFHHMHQKTQLQAIEVSEQYQTVSMLTFSDRPTGADNMFINQYGFDGKSKGNFIIPMNPGIRLSGIQMVHAEDGALLLTGTYQKGVWKGHSGLFTARLSRRTIEAFRFYDYGQLAHFFKFLPKEKEQQMLRRAARKHQKNQHLNLPYLITTSPLQQAKGHWVMAGNVFEEIWKEQEEPCYHFKGTLALCIDADGRLRWDNFMPHQGAILESTVPKHAASAKLEMGKLGIVQLVKDILRHKQSPVSQFENTVGAFLLFDIPPPDMKMLVYNAEFIPMPQHGFLHFGLKELVNRKALKEGQMQLFLQKIQLPQPVIAESKEAH